MVVKTPRGVSSRERRSSDRRVFFFSRVPSGRTRSCEAPGFSHTARSSSYPRSSHPSHRQSRSSVDISLCRIPRYYQTAPLLRVYGYKTGNRTCSLTLSCGWLVLNKRQFSYPVGWKRFAGLFPYILCFHTIFYITIFPRMCGTVALRGVVVPRLRSRRMTVHNFKVASRCQKYRSCTESGNCDVYGAASSSRPSSPVLRITFFFFRRVVHTLELWNSGVTLCLKRSSGFEESPVSPRRARAAAAI